MEPRTFPEKISTIDDWAPVVDTTTKSDYLSWEGIATDVKSNQMLSRGTLERDRVFFASGRGKNGSVVEPRHGIKARIGLDMDLGDPAKDVWLFPDAQSQDGSMNVILALPYSTQVIHIGASFDNVEVQSPEATPFDLSSRTIHASSTFSGYVVQVSEKTITLVTPSQR